MIHTLIDGPAGVKLAWKILCSLPRAPRYVVAINLAHDLGITRTLLNSALRLAGWDAQILRQTIDREPVMAIRAEHWAEIRTACQAYWKRVYPLRLEPSVKVSE